VVYVFDAELWMWDARPDEVWTLVSLPVDAADEVHALTDGRARGFGSVRVTATIGATTWQTSIFPDARRESFVLPVRKAVRTKERLEPGDTARVTVELRDL
jgi:hypothetical protein